MLTRRERARLAGPLIVLMVALTWHGISMFHGVDASMDVPGAMAPDHAAASIVVTIACVAVAAIGIGTILGRAVTGFTLRRAASVPPRITTRTRVAPPLPGRHPPDEGVLLRH